ncbi:zinc-dependent metalloprotease [Longitalea arenae]|uniref:zinc-dependent metalloprotease n=1 Tax=Longitalea arenae TaxID=2812558 RepID=UPI001967DC6D|nr:zinc-dependent metalloprotease [Longitalea arenae]
MFTDINKKLPLLVCCLCVLGLSAIAQKAPKADTAKSKKADTAAALLKTLPKPDALKPYKDIITADAKTATGFFNVHKIDDRCLFELPDSILGRDLLTVNRISRSSSQFRHPLNRLMSYSGDWIGESVIRFEKAPNNKIMLKMVSYRERSGDSSANGLSKLVESNNIQPIYASFPVKTVNKEKNATVIDVTDYLNSDNAVFGYLSDLKGYTNLGAVLPDRSYIDTIRAFPMNIEIKTVKTYGMPKPGSTMVTPVTFEYNNSIVLLPKEPMKGRPYDARVGFFGLWPTDYVDFDANPQGVKKISNIWRWRLEPKPEDVERYNRGELVEPQRPIIIYIDPLTPKKWVPYLIQGVNDWQAAFEKAGFKNAIMAREAPAREEDSTWSIDDARHSALVYKPSDFPNASGPSVKDPRSGEILETHINWYHNVMDILYKWYFIQAGAIDPRANKPHFNDSLMGELIRFVSSHEVGHTLGLRHNWGASSTVPVEKLRDKKWVEAHGHTPSIMDYARFNYVAQPEDHITAKGIFPRIGDYDKWAIEWGYRMIPGNKTAAEEKSILNKWIVNKLKEGPQYFFGIEAVQGEPTTALDPRNQNEDLGDDAMLASAYGIKNLKRIIPNLIKWTQEPDEDYTRAGEMYEELVRQFQRYMGHVLMNIGGVLTTPKTVEQAGDVYSFVPKEKQKRAMAFLQKELFATPEWLRNEQLYNLTSTSFSSVENVQRSILIQLLDAKYILRLGIQEAQAPVKAYTAREMLADLKKGIFSELAAGKAISLNRRNLQKTYVVKLLTLLPPGQTAIPAENEASSVVKANARQLAADLKRAITLNPDAASTDHLKDLHERLIRALEPK